MYIYIYICADPVGFSRRGMKRVRLSLPDPSHWTPKTEVIRGGGGGSQLAPTDLNFHASQQFLPKAHPKPHWNPKWLPNET